MLDCKKLRRESRVEVFLFIPEYLGNDHLRAAAAPLPVIFALYGRIKHRCTPAEEPLGILITHIDTPVAHLDAKIVVPVGAMKCISSGVLEEARPGNTWQGERIPIGCIGITGYAAHVFVGHFREDAEFPCRSCGWQIIR